MLQTVELVFYQLGVRLSQCRIQHDRAFGAFSFGDMREPKPADVVLIQYAMRALEVAVVECARAITLADDLIAVGLAQIEGCKLCWNEWSKRGFVTEPWRDDDGKWQKSFAELEKIVTSRMLESLKNPDAIKWFNIGRKIATIVKSWEGRDWKKSKEAKKLRRTIEPASFPHLCPKITDQQANALLPYDVQVYWSWFQIEAGLRQLVPKLPQGPTTTAVFEVGSPKQGQAAQEAARGSGTAMTSEASSGTDTPSRAAWKSGYLGLQFDDGRRVVRREGIEVEVPLTALNWNLLNKIESFQDRPASREVLGLAWEASDLPKPDDQRIDDALCDLRNRIKPLGIQTKVFSKLGWILISIPTPPVQEPVKKSARKKRK